MVRFKVIKGSHLLLAIAMLLLAAVLAFILIQELSTDRSVSSDVGLTGAAAAIVTETEEAKVLQTFASAASGGLTIEVIADTPKPVAPADARTILIYHTHTHEAYAQDPADPYDAVEAWRTADEQHSVVRVGQALADALTEMGYRVTHDVTDNERDDLSSSYVRALELLESYDTEFDLVIDLHRDAYSEGLPIGIEAPDGTSCAQLMLLVGRGDNYPESQRADYAANLTFAQRVTGEINAAFPGLCRNVNVKRGRHNQHIGGHAMLVEVGHNQNTLAQALNSVPYLARAIDAALNSIA
ncbi:MAG: stage II sporulation protein P [Clostridia bacterium]|nr:stage II sporulation protein P [Clostridia bacterium]